MHIGKLDHVNIKTSNLSKMVKWYREVLDMPEGFRPPFPFPGAWLYAGNDAVVHLVGVDENPQSIDPKIEHFALTASGLADFVKKLGELGVDYDPVRVPGTDILQINIHDPDGNHIHIDFFAGESSD
ncbi:MAG: VOC family protein [Rhizobiaceae bacterium]